MPIINFGGTAQADIGKLHVYDGTDFDQIGKVYGFDGTDNGLIYSAEDWVFKEGVGGEAISRIVVQTGCSSTGAFEVSSSSKVAYKTFNIKCTANQYQWAANYYSDKKLWDLTGVDKITLRWSWESGGQRNIQLGVTDTITAGTGDKAYNNFDNAVLKKVAYGNHNTNSSGELVLDVSDIAGEHYIVFGTACTYNTTANVYFTELHLS